MLHCVEDILYQSIIINNNGFIQYYTLNKIENTQNKVFQQVSLPKRKTQLPTYILKLNQ